MINYVRLVYTITFLFQSHLYLRIKRWFNILLKIKVLSIIKGCDATELKLCETSFAQIENGTKTGI